MQDFRVNIPELNTFILELKRRNVPLTYKSPKTESPRPEAPRPGGPRIDGPITGGARPGGPKTGKPTMPMQGGDWRMKANQANIDMYTEVQKFLDHNMGVKR